MTESNWIFLVLLGADFLVAAFLVGFIKGNI